MSKSLLLIVGIDKAALFWEEENQGMRRSVLFVPVHRESIINHFIFGDVEHQHCFGVLCEKLSFKKEIVFGSFS